MTNKVIIGRYRNTKSNKIARVITETKGQVLVKYSSSRNSSWYDRKYFDKFFIFVEAIPEKKDSTNEGQ